MPTSPNEALVSGGEAELPKRQTEVEPVEPYQNKASGLCWHLKHCEAKQKTWFFGGHRVQATLCSLGWLG